MAYLQKTAQSPNCCFLGGQSFFPCVGKAYALLLQALSSNIEVTYPRTAVGMGGISSCQFSQASRHAVLDNICLSLTVAWNQKASGVSEQKLLMGKRSSLPESASPALKRCWESNWVWHDETPPPPLCGAPGEQLAGGKLLWDCCDFIICKRGQLSPPNPLVPPPQARGEGTTLGDAAPPLSALGVWGWEPSCNIWLGQFCWFCPLKQL